MSFPCLLIREPGDVGVAMIIPWTWSSVVSEGVQAIDPAGA